MTTAILKATTASAARRASTRVWTCDGAECEAGTGELHAARSPSPSATMTMSAEITTETISDQVSPRE